MCKLQIFATINHQPSTINHQPSTINHQPSTISKPSRSHKIQKLIPCIPSESSEFSKSKVQGFSFSHLLAVFPFLRFPVEDLIQARQHGGNTQGHSRRPRTQRLHGGKEKHRFPSFCFVCVYMFLCVKVSTDQKNKNKIVKKFSS